MNVQAKNESRVVPYPDALFVHGYPVSEWCLIRIPNERYPVSACRLHRTRKGYIVELVTEPISDDVPMECADWWGWFIVEPRIMLEPVQTVGEAFALALESAKSVNREFPAGVSQKELSNDRGLYSDALSHVLRDNWPFALVRDATMLEQARIYDEAARDEGTDYENLPEPTGPGVVIPSDYLALEEDKQSCMFADEPVLETPELMLNNLKKFLSNSAARHGGGL